MKRGRGRPCKLTPERQARICQAIAAGNYYEAAAAYGGVHYAIFRMWMVRGEKEKSGKFHDFCEAVHKAEADAEITLVAQWKARAPEDWRAARDFLARRFPDRWGPKDKHEVSGKDGAPLPPPIFQIMDAPQRASLNGHA
jgi:transposase